jgi:flagellar assembly factor FliW
MLIAPAAVLSHTEPAAPPSEPPMQRIASRALGDLEVSPSVVMHFPVPLGGFPLYHAYALVPAARDGLWWLQSMEDPEATFILADPFLHDSEYGFDIGDAEREALGIVDEGDAFGLVMITLPNAESPVATANCRAPLVFNLRQQLAMQIISRDDRHDVRRPIDLARYVPQAHGVRMQ